MRSFLIWLQARLQARLQANDKPASASTMMRGEDGVDDGVDYSTPAVLPGWLRREMETDVRLRESILSSLTYRSQFGNPYRSADDAPIMPVTEDPLLEWDSATRERILSNCHAAYQRNPLAHAAVNFTTDFVVGDGFNLVCKHPEVERILKAFIESSDNAIRKYERQAVNDLQVDGELILRFYSEGGETVVVPQRPWELKWIQTEAGFFRRPEIFHFERVQTEGDSPTRRTETLPEDVPADEIHYVTINDHAYELRGRPELYRVLPWLRVDKEWLEERARQNKWRNALLWHVKVENATSGTIANVAQRWRKPPSPGSAYVSSAAEDVKPLVNPIGGSDAGHDGRAIRLMVILGMRLPEYFFADGANSNLATSTRQELPALTKFEAFQQIMIEQVWTPIFRRVLQNAIDAGVLGETITLTPSPSPSGRGEIYPLATSPLHGEKHPHPLTPSPLHGEGEQSGTQIVGAHSRAPSQTTQNGHYAPAGYPHTVGAGAPTDNHADDVPVRAHSRAPLQPNDGDSVGTSHVSQTISALDAFEVSYEPVTAQDLNALANMLDLAVKNGWASDQTAAEKLGFDPSVERERMGSDQP